MEIVRQVGIFDKWVNYLIILVDRGIGWAVGWEGPWPVPRGSGLLGMVDGIDRRGGFGRGAWDRRGESGRYWANKAGTKDIDYAIRDGLL